ncbi:hypothetical protein BDZ85DRAFT_236329 [Elsinoe ampelina]|uniref:Nascent polypeptide-associated complex subunit alpha-like UBA domain-containing protein n=1 Tax=Elsinoe ampelina TaxID=302913 RepID=A0A6A6GEK7_9PEZI|nr:hypothetical protein BDZ85DRAFT_236329 [Elsinoe ampelina]
MAEPQPSDATKGDTTQSHPAPAGGDDAKAAAALSALDQPSVSDDAPAKKDVDTKALGDAMARLEVASGGGSGTKTGTKTEKKEEETPKKAVKIEAADVAVVVEQCDLNKVKAGELLRQYEGDLGRALRGWIGVGA